MEEELPILFKTTKNILDQQGKVIENADGSITLSEITIFKIEDYIYLRTTTSTVRRTEFQTVKAFLKENQKGE